MLKKEIKGVINRSQKKELRKFGITIGIFLSLVAGFLFWKESSYTVYVAYIGAAFILLGLGIPLILKPIYIIWMSFAVVMGFIVSHIILGFIFGLVFTPAGLIIRLLGKDPLDEKISPQAQSYWIKREKRPFDPSRVEKQY